MDNKDKKHKMFPSSIDPEAKKYNEAASKLAEHPYYKPKPKNDIDEIISKLANHPILGSSNKSFKKDDDSKDNKPKAPKIDNVLDYKKLREEFRQKNSPIGQIKEKRKIAEQKKSAPVVSIQRYKKLFDPDVSGKVDYFKRDGTTGNTKKSENITKKLGSLSSSLTKCCCDNNKNEKLKKCGGILKKMITKLKKIDPKTKLPGIMLNKKNKEVL